MDIDTFLAGAAVQLQAFKAATQEKAKTDATFGLSRTEVDWWYEVAAYMAYVELEEKFQQE